ncbi:hypothetical protein ABKN59_005178 [Abortiporus biennis]
MPRVMNNRIGRYTLRNAIPSGSHSTSYQQIEVQYRSEVDYDSTLDAVNTNLSLLNFDDENHSTTNKSRPRRSPSPSSRVRYSPLTSETTRKLSKAVKSNMKINPPQTFPASPYPNSGLLEAFLGLPIPTPQPSSREVEVESSAESCLEITIPPFSEQSYPLDLEPDSPPDDAPPFTPVHHSDDDENLLGSFQWSWSSSSSSDELSQIETEDTSMDSIPSTFFSIEQPLLEAEFLTPTSDLQNCHPTMSSFQYASSSNPLEQIFLSKDSPINWDQVICL